MQCIYLCLVIACTFGIAHGGIEERVRRMSTQELRAAIVSAANYEWHNMIYYIDEYKEKGGDMAHKNLQATLLEATRCKALEKRDLLIKNGTPAPTPCCKALHEVQRLVLQEDVVFITDHTQKINVALGDLKNTGFDPKSSEPEDLSKKYKIYDHRGWTDNFLYQLLWQECGELLCTVAESKNVPVERMQQLLDFGMPAGFVWKEHQRTQYPCLGYHITPLWQAANKGNTAKIKLLLQYNVSAAPKDNDGFQLLNFAVEHGDPAMARLLLAYGAEVNSQQKMMVAPLEGVTPLQYVATCNHKTNQTTKQQLVLLLLEYKAHVSEVCKKQKYVQDAIREWQEKQKNNEEN